MLFAQNFKTMIKNDTSRITPISFCYLKWPYLNGNNNGTRTKGALSGVGGFTIRIRANYTTAIVRESLAWQTLTPMDRDTIFTVLV